MNVSELKSLLVNPADGTPNGRIVRLLGERGILSAAQIARATGLAKSTVSASLAELRRSGIVVETASETRGSGVGRPAQALMLNPEVGTCIGILFGLGEIQVIVADVSHAIISDVRVEMDYDYSPADAVEVIESEIAAAYRAHDLPVAGQLGVGLAVAGPINPQDGKVMRASVLPTWAGVDLRATFGPVLRRPIYADNESNCAALAEMMWGAAVGYEDFLLFKVDRGVGGAIVAGGRVMTGVAGSAGEFGHMTIDPEGELCRCGNRGCLELYAGFRKPLEYASRRFNRPMTTLDVVAMARAGDVGCRRLIEDTAEKAGRGLGMLATVINPGLIVVSGRLGIAGDMLLDPLRRSYEKHTLVKLADVDGAARTQLVLGRFTENDSCMGALGLVLRHHGRL